MSRIWKHDKFLLWGWYFMVLPKYTMKKQTFPTGKSQRKKKDRFKIWRHNQLMSSWIRSKTHLAQVWIRFKTETIMNNLVIKTQNIKVYLCLKFFKFSLRFFLKRYSYLSTPKNSKIFIKILNKLYFNLSNKFFLTLPLFI